MGPLWLHVDRRSNRVLQQGCQVWNTSDEVEHRLFFNFDAEMLRRPHANSRNSIFYAFQGLV